MIKDSLKALREYIYIYRHFNTYEGIKLNFKPIGILFVYYEQKFTIIYSDFGKNTL